MLMTPVDPLADAVRTGRCYLVVSDLVTFTVTGADTEGAYSVFETISQPQGGPPVLHTHPQQETLYIIEGEYLVSMMASAVLRTMRIGPSGVAHIPGGVPHSFKNVGTVPGKLLAVLSPAGLEYFFAELGVPVADPDHPPWPNSRLDLEHLITILARYHMTFVAPPSETGD
jgi:quercetin dioxygenase-like cupin family protein